MKNQVKDKKFANWITIMGAREHNLKNICLRGSSEQSLAIGDCLFCNITLTCPFVGKFIYENINYNILINKLNKNSIRNNNFIDFNSARMTLFELK